MNTGNRVNTYRRGSEVRDGGVGTIASSAFRHSNIRMEDRRAFPSYDDSSQDEDDEEQERILSDLHGEAEESRTGAHNKRKSGEGDDDKKIEDQYRKALKQPRKTRPKLTYEVLTGSNGLIRLPVEFPEQMKRYIPKSSKDVNGAANYCRVLMNTYERFAHDIMPSSSFEDTLWKIEQLGSTKQTKLYLQQMRNEQRNKYLENALGKEKALRILQDLDDEMDRLAQEQQHTEAEPVATNEDDEPDKPSDEEPRECDLVDNMVSPMQPGGSNDYTQDSPAIPNSASTKKSPYYNMYKKNKSVGSTKKMVVHDKDDEEVEEKEADFELDIQGQIIEETADEENNDDNNFASRGTDVDENSIFDDKHEVDMDDEEEEKETNVEHSKQDETRKKPHTVDDEINKESDISNDTNEMHVIGDTDNTNRIVHDANDDVN